MPATRPTTPDTAGLNFELGHVASEPGPRAGGAEEPVAAWLPMVAIARLHRYRAIWRELEDRNRSAMALVKAVDRYDAAFEPYAIPRRRSSRPADHSWGLLHVLARRIAAQ